MNPEIAKSNGPLRSIYADDETIAEILPIFINNMPRYLSDLEARIAEQNWAAAARVCHDLKGTAGGYGYPDIGQVAHQLETEIKGQHRTDDIERYILIVKSLCERARMGMAAPH